MKATQFPHNLYYLTDQLPPKFGYIKKVTESLNAKGLTSKTGKPYTHQIILNVVRGMHTDDNIKAELECMVEEHGVPGEVVRFFKKTDNQPVSELVH